MSEKETEIKILTEIGKLRKEIDLPIYVLDNDVKDFLQQFINTFENSLRVLNKRISEIENKIK